MQIDRIDEDQALRLLKQAREIQLNTSSASVARGKSPVPSAMRNRIWRSAFSILLFARIISSYIWFGLFVRPTTKKGKRRQKLEAVHEKNAERLYEDFVRLKGVYIKIGQFLSTQAAFLPLPYLIQMAKMQDQMPEATVDEIRARIESEFGKPVEEVFARFDEQPLASASIGQVHRVVLHDGRDAVIKVKYPGIDDYFHADLKIVRRILPVFVKLLEWAVYREKSGIAHAAIIDEFVKYITLELDYLNERANHSRMYEQLAGLRAKKMVIVPKLHDDYCRGAIICMEYVEGHRIMRWYMNPAVPEEKKDWVFRCLVECLFYTISYHGFFQADTHPGNFLIHDEEPESPHSRATLIMLDFGCTKDFPEGFREGVVRVINGYLTRNYEQITDALWEQGFRTKHHTRESFGMWVQQGIRVTDEVLRFFREGTGLIDILRNNLGRAQEEFFSLFDEHRIASIPAHYAMLARVLVTAPVPLEVHMPKVDFLPIAMSYVGILAAKAREEQGRARASA